MECFNVQINATRQLKSASRLVPAIMYILWPGVSTGLARETSRAPVSVMGVVSMETGVWMALVIAALTVAIGLGFLSGLFRLSKRESISQSHEKRVGPRSGHLPESEQRYRRLVEGFSRDYIMYSRGEDQILTYVSPSVKGVLGYEPGELLPIGKILLASKRPSWAIGLSPVS